MPPAAPQGSETAGPGPGQASLRPPGSRALHAIDRIASRPRFAVGVIVADLAWVLYSTAIGFPSHLETVFQTVVAALTLAMVFVIQHTQSREQAVTQRKLDELLRAVPAADNAMITLEEAPDHDLQQARSTHRSARARATAGDSGIDHDGRP